MESHRPNRRTLLGVIAGETLPRRDDDCETRQRDEVTRGPFFKKSELITLVRGETTRGTV